MEANHVARKNTLEQFLLDRQGAPEVPCREGSVQSKPNPTRLPLALETLTEERREKQEMVVVHPDQIAVLRSVGDRICEDLIDALVGLPVILVEVGTRLIMQDGPENRI